MKKPLLTFAALALPFSTLPLAAEDIIIDTAVFDTVGTYEISTDSTITVTQTGSITTDYFGQIIQGDNNTLINSGTITAGVAAQYLDGDNGTISNSGNISSDGDGQLLDFGDNGTVINSGTITSQGYGQHTNGDNGTIVNSGDISSFFGAQYLIGDNGTVTNSGNITTEFTGQYIFGNNGTIVNSGTISSGDVGQFLYGDSGTIVNSGTISSGGVGQNTDGSNGIISNSGTITSEGAAQLSNKSDNGTITNTGTITSGKIAQFHLDGDNGTINNSGSISSKAGGQSLIFGDNGTVTNSGTIIASGIGQRIFGDDGTVTNSGTVISQDDGISISAEGDNVTVNLLAGSVLQGDIDFRDADTATLNFGAGLNAVVAVSDAPETITVDGGVYAVSDDAVYVVDTASSGFHVIDETTYSTGDVVQDAVSNRATLSSHKNASTSQFWSQAIASAAYASDSDDTAAYQSFIGGLVIGRDFTDEKGFFASALVGQVESDDDDAFEIESTSIVLGGYWALKPTTDLSVAIGYGEHGFERKIADSRVEGGLAALEADFETFFINPELSWRDSFGINDSQVTLGYTGLFTPEYSETGSDAGITFDSRLSHRFSVGLEVQRALTKNVTIHTGLDMQYTTGGLDQFTLADDEVSFDTSADGLSARGYAGLDLAVGHTGGGRIALGADSEGKVDALLAFNIAF